MTTLEQPPEGASSRQNQEALPYFLGYDGWELDGWFTCSDPRGVWTHEGFAFLSGTAGPWFMREIAGQYNSVVIVFNGWGNRPSLQGGLEIVIRDNGYNIVRLDDSERNDTLQEMPAEDIYSRFYDGVVPQSESILPREPIL